MVSVVNHQTREEVISYGVTNKSVSEEHPNFLVLCKVVWKRSNYENGTGLSKGLNGSKNNLYVNRIDLYFA